MKRRNEKKLIQTIGLGLISGMRTTFAPAIAAHYLSNQRNSELAKSKLGFIQSPAAAVVTKLLGVAEIIGDKLPNTPDRIVAPQIIARAVSGAFAGAIISAANKDNIAKGVLLGGATALAATFGAYCLRKYISKSGFIEEPVTGMFEDAFAIGIGALLMK